MSHPYVTVERPTTPAGWWHRAACAGMDALYDETDTARNGHDPLYEAAIADAKSVCARCPVAAECLLDAIDERRNHTTNGLLSNAVRAGLTAAEIDALARRHG